MSHAVAILATMIVMTLVVLAQEEGIRKDYAKSGFFPIGGKVYRLVEVEK